MSESQISPTGVFSSALEQIKEISQVGGTEDSQIEPVVFTPKDEVSSDSFKHKKRADNIIRGRIEVIRAGFTVCY